MSNHGACYIQNEQHLDPVTFKMSNLCPCGTANEHPHYPVARRMNIAGTLSHGRAREGVCNRDTHDACLALVWWLHLFHVFVCVF